MRRIWQIISQFLLLGVVWLLGYVCEASVWGKLENAYIFPFFIFMCLFLGGYFLLLTNTKLLPSTASLWLFIPPIFFSFTASLSSSQPTSLKYIISLVFTFLYIALLTMTYRGGRLADFCLFDYLQGFYNLFIGIIRQPIQFVRQIFQMITQLTQDLSGSFQGGGSTDGVSIKYGRGIALLMFAALFLLFWWADYAFRLMFTNWSGFDFLSKGGSAFWGTSIWSYLILGLVLYAGTQSQNTNLISEDTSRYFNHWFNFGFSIRAFFTILVIVITYTVLRVYCLFNSGQCTGADGFPAWVDGKYGFWALTAAGVLVFLLVLWLDHVTVFGVKMERSAHTILNIFLFLNEIIILGVASMSVSTATFGIHAMRHIWYARAGLFWLLLMFAMFIYYEQVERECDFPFAALVVTSVLVGLYTFFGGLLAAFGIGLSW